MRDLNNIFGVSTYKTHGAQVTFRGEHMTHNVMVLAYSVDEIDEKVAALQDRHPEWTLIERRDEIAK